MSAVEENSLLRLLVYLGLFFAENLNVSFETKWKLEFCSVKNIYYGWYQVVCRRKNLFSPEIVC